MKRWGKILLIALVVACAPACKKDTAPIKSVKKEKITTPPIQMNQTTTASPVAGRPSPDTATTNHGPPTTNSEVTGDRRPATGDGTQVPSAPPPTVAFAPKPVKALTQINVVLDGSGSMNAPMEAETKIAFAKGVLKDLLMQPHPAEAKRHLGIRVFGTQKPLEANACDDTQLLAPVQPIEPDKLSTLIGGIAPKGTAPIAAALEQAAADFPDHADADNVILLIADGTDSCKGDPCAVAEKIHAGPKKPIIHVIGFDLDQKAQEQLRCVAAKGDGQFYLARNNAELRSAVDQAANANLPYNLRLKVMAGATPLPTQITVMRSGTDQVMEKGTAPGIKFFQLAPGTYDIAIEYVDSVEAAKPSKILKGVEIQTSSRAEQIVQFDLGQLTLATIDPQGQPAKVTYEFRKAGLPAVIGTVEAGPEAKTVSLTPGAYDVSVSGLSAGTVPLSNMARVEVINGGAKEQTFRFETGAIFLRAQTAQEHFVKATYKVADAARPDQTIAEGELPPEGAAVTLPTGTYNVATTPMDDSLKGIASVSLNNVEVKAGATEQQLMTFAFGTLVLSGKDVGKDGKGVTAKTEFQIRKTGSTDVVAEVLSESTPVTAYVAPGAYDIVALNVGANITPAPSILWKEIAVKENETVTHEANFQLGEIKIVSRNARGGIMPGIFTVFRSGTDEPLGTMRSDANGVTFRLTPGSYDLRVEDGTVKSEPRPTVWFRDVAVVSNTSVSREATFISGKIKVGCRGENDVVLPCEFRIFTYGMDRPLFSGMTGEQWKEFDINPGKYYMEAGFHDPKGEQLLKKWINISVTENQVVEQIIRF